MTGFFKIGVRVIAFAVGLGLILVSADASISAVGGYAQPTAKIILALAPAIAIGAVVVGLAWSHGRRSLAVAVVLALLAGELYHFGSTAERVIAARDAAQTPLRDAEASHRGAIERVAKAEQAVAEVPTTTERLKAAETAKATADAAALAKSAEKGCRENCRLLLEEQVRMAQSEVDAARVEIRALASNAAVELDAARRSLEANRLPPSATPLADKLGIEPWKLDLAMAALLSLGVNGLAALLIAFASHGSSARPTDSAAADSEESPWVAEDPDRTLTVQTLEPLGRHEPSTALAVPDKPKPRLVSDLPPAISVVDFAIQSLQRAPESETDVDDFYFAYLGHCRRDGRRALKPAEFMSPLKRLCTDCGIALRGDDNRVFLVGVRIASEASEEDDLSAEAASTMPA